MRIGTLRRRLTIQQAVNTPDSAGGETQAWSPFATVWSGLEGLSGDELAQFDQVDSHVTSRATIRWRAGVKPEMRVYEAISARTFEIRSVIDPDARKRQLELMLEEIRV